MTTSKSDRILVMGATNRPKDIDEAALRYQYSIMWNVKCSSHRINPSYVIVIVIPVCGRGVKGMPTFNITFLEIF